MPGPERGDQAHDPADEEKPAEDDGDGDAGRHRNQDGQDAENEQDYALDKEQDPMLANGLRDRALQLSDVARTRHVRSPSLRCLGGNSNMNASRQYRSEERRVGKECRSRWSPY